MCTHFKILACSVWSDLYVYTQCRHLVVASVQTHAMQRISGNKPDPPTDFKIKTIHGSCRRLELLFPIYSRLSKSFFSPNFYTGLMDPERPTCLLFYLYLQFLKIVSLLVLDTFKLTLGISVRVSRKFCKIKCSPNVHKTH